MSEIITFGKHRGRTIAALFDSKQYGYVFWLLSHDWFRLRYPAHYAEARRKMARHLSLQVAWEQYGDEALKAERWTLTSPTQLPALDDKVNAAVDAAQRVLTAELRNAL